MGAPQAPFKLSEYSYTPPEWNRGLLTQLAAAKAGTGLLRICEIGDSVAEGVGTYNGVPGGVDNYDKGSFTRQIRQKLLNLAGVPNGSDFYPSVHSDKTGAPGWNTGWSTNYAAQSTQRWFIDNDDGGKTASNFFLQRGYVYQTPTWTTITGVANLMHFVSPACTDFDIAYMKNNSGTWKVDIGNAGGDIGSGGRTLTLKQSASGSPDTFTSSYDTPSDTLTITMTMASVNHWPGRMAFAGFPNSARTLQFRDPSNTSNCIIPGVTVYASAAARSTGLHWGRFSQSGQALYHFREPYRDTSGNYNLAGNTAVPRGRMAAHGGAIDSSTPHGFGSPVEPHFVILELVINDIQALATNSNGGVQAFKEDYIYFIRCLRSAYTTLDVSILLVVPSMPHFYKSDTTTSWQNYYDAHYFVDAMYEIARMMGCGLVDFNQAWKDRGYTRGFYNAISDVHPSYVGAKNMADVIWPMLLKDY